MARNRDTISFIEVKTRGGHPGSAERSVGFVKQEHLTKAAKYYCRQWNINLLQTSIQFEQISVYYDKVSKKAKITKYLLPVGVKSRYYRWFVYLDKIKNTWYYHVKVALIAALFYSHLLFS